MAILYFYVLLGSECIKAIHKFFGDIDTWDWRFNDGGSLLLLRLAHQFMVICTLGKIAWNNAF